MNIKRKLFSSTKTEKDKKRKDLTSPLVGAIGGAATLGGINLAVNKDLNDRSFLNEYYVKEGGKHYREAERLEKLIEEGKGDIRHLENLQSIEHYHGSRLSKKGMGMFPGKDGFINVLDKEDKKVLRKNLGKRLVRDIKKEPIPFVIGAGLGTGIGIGVNKLKKRNSKKKS